MDMYMYIQHMYVYTPSQSPPLLQHSTAWRSVCSNCFSSNASLYYTSSTNWTDTPPTHTHTNHSKVLIHSHTLTRYPLPFVRATVPKKLTSMTFLSTDKSVSKTAPRELIPALLTRMSNRPPNAWTASSTLPGNWALCDRSRGRTLGE